MDLPFNGQVFYLHSSLRPLDKKELAQSIATLGGTTTAMFTAKTTLVIASKTIRNSSDYQLRKATVDGIPVKGPSFVREQLEKFNQDRPSASSSRPAQEVESSFSLVPSALSLDLTTTDALTATISEVVPATAPVTGNTKVRK